MSDSDKATITKLEAKVYAAYALADEYYELNEKLIALVEELELLAKMTPLPIADCGGCIKLQATIDDLTAALERIAGRRNCYNDINGCGAAKDAKLALKQEGE